MTNKFTHPGVWLSRRIDEIFAHWQDRSKDGNAHYLVNKIKQAADEATNNVRMEREVLAGGMKLGAYRVRDPATREYGPLQYHMTHGNSVVAVAGENAAKLFASFVFDTLGGKKCISEVAAETKANIHIHSETPDAESFVKAQARMVEGPPTITPLPAAPMGWTLDKDGTYLHRLYGAQARLVCTSDGVQLWAGVEYVGTFQTVQAAADYASKTIIILASFVTSYPERADEGSGV